MDELREVHSDTINAYISASALGLSFHESILQSGSARKIDCRMPS